MGLDQIMLGNKTLIENIDYVHIGSTKLEVQLSELPSAGQRLRVVENVKELFAVPGQTFKFILKHDFDIDMDFRLVQAPSWASFDGDSGVLSLSPSEDVEAGLYSLTLLTVGDHDVTASHTFEIVIQSISIEEKNQDGKNNDQSFGFSKRFKL